MHQVLRHLGKLMLFVVVWTLYSAEGDNEERFFCNKLAAVNPPNPAPKINIRFPTEDN